MTTQLPMRYVKEPYAGAVGIEALNKPKKRKSFTLYQAGLKDGDELTYSKDENIKAIIVSAKKVMFEGLEESLSSSVLKLLHRDGYKWQQANGWAYWTYDGETIAERLNNRLSSVEDD